MSESRWDWRDYWATMGLISTQAFVWGSMSITAKDKLFQKFTSAAAFLAVSLLLFFLLLPLYGLIVEKLTKPEVK